MGKISVTHITEQYHIEESTLKILYYQEILPIEEESGEFLLEDRFEDELEWILRMHIKHEIPMKSMDLIYYMYCKNRDLQQRLNGYL